MVLIAKRVTILLAQATILLLAISAFGQPGDDVHLVHFPIAHAGARHLRSILDASRLYWFDDTTTYCYDLVNPFQVELRYQQTSARCPYVQNVIVPVGGLIYTSNYDFHSYMLRVIDNHDPGSPSVLWDVALPFSPTEPTISFPQTRLIAGRYLMLMGRVRPAWAAAIYDLRDPERPELAAVVPGLPSTLVPVSDRYAIATGWNSVKTYSLANPLEPVFADSDSVGYVSSFSVRDSLICAFVCDSTSDTDSYYSLHVLSMDENTGELSKQGSCEPVIVKPPVYYVASTITEENLAILSCGTRVKIWDISDPTAPHYVGWYKSLSNRSGRVYAMGHYFILDDYDRLSYFEMLSARVKPSLNANRIEFAAISVNSADTFNLQLTSPADTGLIRVKGLQVDSRDFEVLPFGRWLRPQEVWNRSIIFHPTTLGICEATLTIILAGDSVMSMPLSGMGLAEAARPSYPDMPLTISFAICPNPFNQSATIEFSIPSNDEIVLQMLDISGRIVETLAKGRFAKGAHRCTFNASTLSSGVYFSRLLTSKRTYFKKAILMR